MPNASLVIANWKMNGNKALAKEIVTSLRDKISKNQESIKSAKKRSSRLTEFDMDNLDFTL